MWCCTNYSLLSDGNYWDWHKMSLLMEIIESERKWLKNSKCHKIIQWSEIQQLVKTILTCSSPEQVKNTTHAVPRFRGAHVSQSGAPKGDPHWFQCYNSKDQLDFLEVPYVLIVLLYNISRIILSLSLWSLSLNIIYCSYKETGSSIFLIKID